MADPFRDPTGDDRTLLGLAAGCMSLGVCLGTAFVLLGTTPPGDGSGSTPVAVDLDTASLFVSNLAVFFGLVFGGLLFGVPTVVGLVQNGFVLGILTAVAVREGELAQFLLLVLPHGVVELPAFWIAGSLGFEIPRGVYRVVQEDGDSPVTRAAVRRYATGLLVGVALLAIAATIESTITASLARRL